MKTALIITGGDFHELPDKIEYDYVIACDSGAEYANRLNVKPNVILGDFDSYADDVTKLYGQAEVLTFPVEKDDTDTMLAIKLAFERGYEHIIIVCALGKRMDHTIANIQSLNYIASHGGMGEIISATEHIRTLSAKEGCVLVSKNNKKSVSLFSLTDRCEGLTIKGAKYNVDNVTLTNDFPLGHGNSVVGDSASISIKSGVLLIIESQL